LLQNNTIEAAFDATCGRRAGGSGAARGRRDGAAFLDLGKISGPGIAAPDAAAAPRATREINSPVALILFTQNGALKRAQPFPFSLHSVASFLVI
jgi:hypothetical protein